MKSNGNLVEIEAELLAEIQRERPRDSHAELWDKIDSCGDGPLLEVATNILGGNNKFVSRFRIEIRRVFSKGL